MRKLAFLAAATVGLMSGAAQAAPFMTVSLEARQGSNPFSNVLEVQAGQTYDYRVNFTLAPVGTTNTNPAGTTNDTITSYAASTANGLNNLKLSLFQSTGQAIQLDFALPTLDGAFDEPPGATVGVLTSRGNGSDDLIGVQATATSGFFWGVPVANVPAPTALLSGTFTVPDVGNGAVSVASIGLQGVPAGTFFGLKYNNTATYNGTTLQQAGADAPINFQGLTLTAVPEPASVGLLALSGLALTRLRRRSR